MAVDSCSIFGYQRLAFVAKICLKGTSTSSDADEASADDTHDSNSDAGLRPLMNVDWRGASGAIYHLQLFEIGRRFTFGGGVYVFCKQAMDRERWLAIYVGETENFNERLNLNLVNHHRWDCIRREGATHVCVRFLVGDQAARAPIESDLTLALNPACNRR
jgi:hypothetical protein